MHAWQSWVVHEEFRISRSELCSHRIFNSETIFLGFEKGRLREPSRRENLEWVRVLSRIQSCSTIELHHDLPQGNYLLYLAMELLELLRVYLHMAAFDSTKLDDEVGGLKVLSNFNVNCTRYSISSIESLNVVVKVDVDGALEIPVKCFIPEYACVRPPRCIRNYTWQAADFSLFDLSDWTTPSSFACLLWLPEAQIIERLVYKLVNHSNPTNSLG